MKKGSPIKKFYTGIRTDATRPTYELYLNNFLKYSKHTPDSLAELDPKLIDDLIFDYLGGLKLKTEKEGKPSPNSYGVIFAPIQLFCEQNDIPLNWRKYKRSFPRKQPSKNQGAYINEDIIQMLKSTTSKRNQAWIHFLASVSPRVGALTKLNVSDIEPIENGAIVTLYRDDIEEYRSCLTPEAFSALGEYFEYRIQMGYPVVENSPVFCDKSNHERIKSYNAQDLMRNILRTSGLRGHRAEKTRKSKSPNQAFRKRFEITLANAGIQPKYADYFQGHFEGQTSAYFRDQSNEDLWKQFKKAIPELTIDKSEKLKFENDLKDEKIVEYETKLKDELENVKAEQARQNNILKESRFQYLNVWMDDPNSLEDDEIKEYNKLIRELGIERCKKIASSPDYVVELTGIRLEVWKKYGAYWNLPENEFNKFLKHPRKYREDDIREACKQVLKNPSEYLDGDIKEACKKFSDKELKMMTDFSKEKIKKLRQK